MTKLTKEQKETYLKDPYCCPYCKSKNIEAGSIEANEGWAWQEVVCFDCHLRWRDVYTLTAVEDIE